MNRWRSSAELDPTAKYSILVFGCRYILMQAIGDVSEIGIRESVCIVDTFQPHALSIMPARHLSHP